MTFVNLMEFNNMTLDDDLAGDKILKRLYDTEVKM